MNNRIYNLYMLISCAMVIYLMAKNRELEEKIEADALLIKNLTELNDEHLDITKGLMKSMVHKMKVPPQLEAEKKEIVEKLGKWNFTEHPLRKVMTSDGSVLWESDNEGRVRLGELGKGKHHIFYQKTPTTHVIGNEKDSK